MPIFLLGHHQDVAALFKAIPWSRMNRETLPINFTFEVAGRIGEGTRLCLQLSQCPLRSLPYILPCIFLFRT